MTYGKSRDYHRIRWERAQCERVERIVGPLPVTGKVARSIALDWRERVKARRRARAELEFPPSVYH
jgi:hypothetical protein